MEKSKLNNFKKQLKQYNEKFLITNEDNFFSKLINTIINNQGDLMNNNKKNQYLEMFLNIADELLENQYIKSRRDFSSRYLNKCSNYIGSLVYQDKQPSIASGWALFVNLNRNKQLPHWQEKLSETLYNMALKD